MKLLTKLFTFVTLTAALASSSFGQVTKQSDGRYLIRLNYTLGQEFKARMTTSMQGSFLGQVESEPPTTVEIHTKVVSVEDGLFTLSNSSKLLAGGDDPYMMENEESKINSLGELVEGPESFQAPTGSGFPKEAIPLFGAWDGNFSMGESGLPTDAIKMKYRLVAVRKDFAVVTMNGVIDVTGIKIRMDGSYFVRVSDGHVHSMEATLTLDPSSMEGMGDLKEELKDMPGFDPSDLQMNLRVSIKMRTVWENKK